MVRRLLICPMTAEWLRTIACKRLTLKKGKNIIRGAIINGPGMSDFCIRLLDEKGAPIKNITISYK